MSETSPQKTSIRARLVSFLRTMVGLLLLGIALWGGFLLLRWVGRLFTSIPNEVSASLVAAFGTVLVSVVSILLARNYDRRNSIEQELRKNKIPIYDSFVAFWFKLLLSSKAGKPAMSEAEMTNFFAQFTQGVLVWGSDEVVHKWSAYRRSFGEGTVDKSKLFEFEDLLMAIRRDVGYKNKSIVQGDLLGLFVNDIDKFTKGKANPPKSSG